MNMKIVTLTTDWGNDGFYAASVKGKLLSLIPDVQVVDISHNVKKFDILDAYFILKNSYHYFPEGSIHIVGVNSIESSETPHILVGYKNHYFICADNAIMAYIIGDDKPDFIIDINFNSDSDLFNFPCRDLFVKIAAEIFSGKNIDELGERKNSLNQSIYLPEPAVFDDRISGSVIYIDNYSNVFTNISRELFMRERKARSFKIELFGTYSMRSISNSYLDVMESDFVAIFNDLNLLELAICKGELAKLLSVELGSSVQIYFDK